MDGFARLESLERRLHQQPKAKKKRSKKIKEVEYFKKDIIEVTPVVLDAATIDLLGTA